MERCSGVVSARCWGLLNGAFRDVFVEPVVGEYAGHVLSAVILAGVIIAVTFLFIKRMKLAHEKTILFMIGIVWLVLIVVFEFVFGYYLLDVSWEILMADYDVLSGRLWSLVLLTVLAAPSLSGWILKKKSQRY